MKKVIFTLFALFPIFAQSESKNNVNIGFSHQFTAYSVNYENTISNQFALSIGIANSQYQFHENIINAFPIQFKYFFGKRLLKEFTLGSTIVLNSKTLHFFSFGLSSSKKKGISLRSGIDLPLNYNNSSNTEFNLSAFLIITFNIGLNF